MKARSRWEGTAFEIGELIDAGDKVAAEVLSQLRGKASGATVAWSYWQVATIRNGKWVRAEWFIDRAEALEAAGLSE